MATHGRYWDEGMQQWKYEVHIQQVRRYGINNNEQAPIINEKGQNVVELISACDGQTLPQYCMMRGEKTANEVDKLAWMILSAKAAGGGRTECLRVLGIGRGE